MKLIFCDSHIVFYVLVYSDILYILIYLVLFYPVSFLKSLKQVSQIDVSPTNDCKPCCRGSLHFGEPYEREPWVAKMTRKQSQHPRS